VLCCVSRRRFPELARKHGFQYVEGNLGYFWTFWNERPEIQPGILLLASDVSTGQTLRHFALEEMTEVFGLAGPHQFLPRTFFSSRGDDGGAAEHLSTMDMQLTEFTYRSIAPGSRTAEVRTGVRRYWGRD
jgi:hypothetical protein